jgi:hypothetical protein
MPLRVPAAISPVRMLIRSRPKPCVTFTTPAKCGDCCPKLRRRPVAHGDVSVLQYIRAQAPRHCRASTCVSQRAISTGSPGAAFACRSWPAPHAASARHPATTTATHATPLGTKPCTRPMLVTRERECALSLGARSSSAEIAAQ